MIQERDHVISASSAGPKVDHLPRKTSLTSAVPKPQAKRRRRPSPPKKTTELPENFVPSNYSVLCGKGSENYNAIGK